MPTSIQFDNSYVLIISLQLRPDLATWTHFDLDALFFADLTWTRVQGVQVATWTQCNTDTARCRAISTSVPDHDA